MRFQDSSIRLSILLLFLAVCQISHSQGTIHDAVFSPDGSSIAVGGTKGVYRYRLDGMELVDTIQTTNDVQFIRWSPDLLHLFIAQWDESIPDSKVTYSIIDIKDKSILYNITNNIRWVGRLVGQDFETYDRPKKEASHPNTFVFSTSGDNFAYIDNSNQIMIGDTQTGQLVKILNPIDSPVIPSRDTLSALGYISEEEMYACTYNGRNFAIKNDQFTEKENLIKDTSTLLKDTIPQQTIFISKNWDYAISLSPISIDPNPYHDLFVYKRKEGDLFEFSWFPIMSLYTNRARQRALFCLNDKKMVILTHSIKNSNREPDLTDSITMHIECLDNSKERFSYSIGKSSYGQSTQMNILLLQPISPDGEYFLLLQEEGLYLFKTKTYESKIILPKSSAVSNFMEMGEN